MNFKFTAKKVIFSIVIAIVIFSLYLLFITRYLENLSPTKDMQIILKVIDLSHPFSSGNILLILAIFFIVYLIWSLFQKEPSSYQAY